MKTTLTGLYNYFQKAAGLKYVRSITVCDDMNKLIEAGKFPIINIEGTKKAYQEFEGFHPDTAEQPVFNVIIQFATKHAEYKTATMGKADVKGIWELSDDIYDTIRDYLESIKRTSGSLSIVKKPSIYSRTWTMADREYMAGADLTIDLAGEIFFSS